MHERRPLPISILSIVAFARCPVLVATDIRLLVTIRFVVPPQPPHFSSHNFSELLPRMMYGRSREKFLLLAESWARTFACAGRFLTARAEFLARGSVTGYFRRDAGTSGRRWEYDEQSQSSRARGAADFIDDRGIRSLVRGRDGGRFKNVRGAWMLRRSGDHVDHGAEHAGSRGGTQYSQRGTARTARSPCR